MAERYLLPAELGGGECTVLHGWAREGEFVDVSVDLADGSGCVNLTLHRSWLTAVKPPLPPEPPNGTVM
jgi:hypothetical protein